MSLFTPISLDPTRHDNPAKARTFLRSLVTQYIIHPEEWASLSSELHEELDAIADRSYLLKRLVEIKLLNSYQADRIQSGMFRGLVFGNYRLKGTIGDAGDSFFQAEHIYMRRQVAVKVVPFYPEEQPDLISRFLRDMRFVARLDHPNIVAAFDAGIAPREIPGEPDLYYFVMEHLAGADLERLAEGNPLAISTACTLCYQIASALDEANHHALVHRDVRPANIFITETGQAKLLDFGLIRQTSRHAYRISDDCISALEYMAPEQVIPGAQIDVRTDIFGLGASLFYALTGTHPFQIEGTLIDAIEKRKIAHPRNARSIRGEIPEGLDRILGRMMAVNKEDRYANPQAVMHALLPFLDGSLGSRGTRVGAGRVAASPRNGEARAHRILVVERDAAVRKELVRPLFAHQFECVEAMDGETALELLRSGPTEAILLGVDLPGMDGRTVLKTVRENPPSPNLKIIMTASHCSTDEMAAFLSDGADDFFCLPISNLQLVSRVASAVKHKQAQDRTHALSRQLLDMNMELERALTSQSSDFLQARNALVLALARLVEYRSTETIAHLSRIQRYSVLLAQEAMVHPNFADQINQDFIQTIGCCAPLHDIGNVGLPDHVLLKAARLDEDERRIMQTHTVIGAETLQHVVRRFGPAIGFLRMAIDIARHHHEHYDGSGYPDGLAGTDIPLAARIVAVADAYDSLRSRRSQRPGLAHSAVIQIMTQSSAGKYDPLLLGAFLRCAPQFDRTFRELPDSIMLE